MKNSYIEKLRKMLASALKQLEITPEDEALKAQVEEMQGALS